MSDRIYCLSNPDEPGLVRIAQWHDDGFQQGDQHGAALCGPGEEVDWSLDVDNARAATAAIDRTMRWYRKNRGGGVYRCSAKDAWNITIRYGAARRRSGRLSSFGVSDVLLTAFLAIALLSGILAMQAPAMETAMSLSVTAIVMAMLTVCLAFARDRVAA